MEAFIKAISYYLPEKVVTNEQLVEEFPEWSVDKVAQKVGVDSRHLAADDETAGDMAEKADADNDLGNYIVYADGIDVAAKHFYSVGRITKKNWDTLLYRYEE